MRLNDGTGVAIVTSVYSNCAFQVVIRCIS